MLATPVLAAFILAAVPAAAQTSSVERRQLDEAQHAYQRGQERMQAESFEEAARHFRTAVQAYLSCRDVFASLASLDASQHNTRDKVREDEIREVKESLLRVQQGKVKTASGLGLEVQLQERLRVLEGARMRGKEQIVSVPAGLMLGLGSAHFRSGQMAEAQVAFAEAVKIDPKLGPAHNNLAVMYMMSGRFEDAKQEVRRAEKAGTRVADSFKQELERRAREAAPPR